MDKTTANEETQKKNRNSAKTEKRIKISGKMAVALKREWEDFAKRQGQRGIKVSARNKIRSVSLTKNQHGKISVRVNMENGARLFDNAKEHNVDKFKARAESVYRRSRIEELLKKIKEYGYAAVEGEIPAELKEAVLKSMEKANISTSYKGEKAEAEAARQAAQNAADQAAKPSNAAEAGPLASLNPQKGFLPYEVQADRDIQNAINKGYLEFQPKAIPDYYSKKAQEEAIRIVSENMKHTAKACTYLNEENPPKNMKNIKARVTEGKPGSTTVEATVITSEGKEISVQRSGSPDQIRSSTAQIAYMAKLCDTKDKSTLSEADRNYLDNFLKVLAKKTHGVTVEDLQGLSFEQIIQKNPKALNYLGNVSSKGITKEAKDGRSSEKAYLADAQEADRKAKQEIDEKNKRNQAIEAVRSDPSKLPEEALKIREAAESIGLSGENITHPENADKLAALTNRNELFVKGNGGFLKSCTKEAIEGHQKYKEEKKKRKNDLSEQRKNIVIKTLGKEEDPTKLTPNEKKLIEELNSLKVPPKEIAQIMNKGLSPEEAFNALCKVVKEAQPTVEKPGKAQEKTDAAKQPVATAQPKQQTQSNETEADRVKNKIKENMQTYRASSEKAVAPAKQKAGKVGLQQKIQQEAKNPNTSSRQQAPSPAVQAALLKRKEGQGR